MAISNKADARPGLSHLFSVINAFIGDEAVDTRSIGEGNINDTYLVQFKQCSSVVLQRLNASVFPDPGCVADNGALVTAHLGSKQKFDSAECRAYRFPEVIETKTGTSCFQDDQGEIWRCISYIQNSVGYTRVIKREQPFEAGRILGCFHTLLADMDQSLLCEPLPGFHDLHKYKGLYRAAVESHQRRLSPELNYCRKMVEERLKITPLNDLAAEQGIENIIIHGDPKCDNFLFDVDTEKAVSLIDFDTVSTGPAAVDIGDCLRSFCNPAGEKAVSGVYFDSDICARLLDGYRQTAPMSETQNLVYPGVRLLTYELGLRFFSDYLVGDRYFKVADKRENLRRACVQFQLLESIEKQRSAIEKAARA